MTDVTLLYPVRRGVFRKAKFYLSDFLNAIDKAQGHRVVRQCMAARVLQNSH